MGAAHPTRGHRRDGKGECVMAQFDMVITWQECQSVRIEAETYEEASKKAYALAEQPPWGNRAIDWNLYPARPEVPQ